MLPFIQRARQRRRQRASSFIVFGKAFASRDAAIKHYGLNKATIISRIKAGWSNDDAFNPNSSRAVSYEGKTYQSLNKLAKSLNVPLFTLKKRLRLGMTLKAALTQPFPSAKKTIVIRGKTFESFGAACAFYKISRLVVKARLRFGWSLNQAFGLEQRGTENCEGKVYFIQNALNEKYYVGITTGSLQARFNKHKSDAKSKPSCKFHFALNEIGHKNFFIREVALAGTYKELHDLEINFIALFDSIKNGYNSMLGGARTSGIVKV